MRWRGSLLPGLENWCCRNVLSLAIMSWLRVMQLAVVEVGLICFVRRRLSLSLRLRSSGCFRLCLCLHLRLCSCLFLFGEVRVEVVVQTS